MALHQPPVKGRERPLSVRSTRRPVARAQLNVSLFALSSLGGYERQKMRIISVLVIMCLIQAGISIDICSFDHDDFNLDYALLADPGIVVHIFNKV